MNKILITGVAGFIGSKVASRFLKEGYEVVGVDDLSVGKDVNIPKGVEFVRGDLALQDTMNKLPLGCKKILHLAGQSSGEISFDDPVSDLEKNTISTVNLINYGIKNKAERIVYASSMSVYGNVADKPISENIEPKPLSCYGVGKLAAEGYLKVYSQQLPYVSLRMFNVYGPGQDLSNMRQGMVSIFLAQALQNGNEVIVKGGLDRFRDFVFIDDVVEVWFRATLNDFAKNQVINVGTGVRTTVEDLLLSLKEQIPLFNYFVQGSTPGDQNGIFSDPTKLKEILEIPRLVELNEGLPEFVQWARLQPNFN